VDGSFRRTPTAEPLLSGGKPGPANGAEFRTKSDARNGEGAQCPFTVFDPENWPENGAGTGVVFLLISYLYSVHCRTRYSLLLRLFSLRKKLLLCEPQTKTNDRIHER